MQRFIPDPYLCILRALSLHVCPSWDKDRLTINPFKKIVQIKIKQTKKNPTDWKWHRPWRRFFLALIPLLSGFSRVLQTQVLFLYWYWSQILTSRKTGFGAFLFVSRGCQVTHTPLKNVLLVPFSSCLQLNIIYFTCRSWSSSYHAACTLLAFCWELHPTHYLMECLFVFTQLPLYRINNNIQGKINCSNSRLDTETWKV